jgi:hypothetical protein
VSILDFTTGLFREPANLRSFVDDPDHPLQTVAHAADPVRALAEFDIAELVADVHHHHHETKLIEKALGSAECRPGDEEDDEDEPAETIHVGHWVLVEEGDKGLGEPLAPQIEEGGPVPINDYPDLREVDEPGDDHAPDDGGLHLDISGVVWGEAVE